MDALIGFSGSSIEEPTTTSPAEPAPFTRPDPLEDTTGTTPAVTGAGPVLSVASFLLRFRDFKVYFGENGFLSTTIVRFQRGFRMLRTIYVGVDTCSICSRICHISRGRRRHRGCYLHSLVTQRDARRVSCTTSCTNGGSRYRGPYM